MYNDAMSTLIKLLWLTLSCLIPTARSADIFILGEDHVKDAQKRNQVYRAMEKGTVSIAQEGLKFEGNDPIARALLKNYLLDPNKSTSVYGIENESAILSRVILHFRTDILRSLLNKEKGPSRKNLVRNLFTALIDYPSVGEVLTRLSKESKVFEGEAHAAWVKSFGKEWHYGPYAEAVKRLINRLLQLPKTPDAQTLFMGAFAKKDKVALNKWNLLVDALTTDEQLICLMSLAAELHKGLAKYFLETKIIAADSIPPELIAAIDANFFLKNLPQSEVGLEYQRKVILEYRNEVFADNLMKVIENKWKNRRFPLVVIVGSLHSDGLAKLLQDKLKGKDIKIAKEDLAHWVPPAN